MLLDAQQTYNVIVACLHPLSVTEKRAGSSFDVWTSAMFAGMRAKRCGSRNDKPERLTDEGLERKLPFKNAYETVMFDSELMSARKKADRTAAVPLRG